MITQALVLGSSSPHRKELLARLGLEFDTHSPDIDESPKVGETPQDLVERLSINKAKASSVAYPNALIIGSDQVAVLEGQIVGKPKDHQDAIRQLSDASGKQVNLYTGLCLYNAASGSIQHSVETYQVKFRKLALDQIEHYLETDKPYGCAGSLKSESLGIALLESLKGNDPNTLIGLPLIRLTDMLIKEGIAPV